jgi:L-threonylcarbamoyladenylate synthase
MTTFVYAEPLSPGGLLATADVSRIAAALRGGGLAVLPTETGYLLGAAVTSVEALHHVFAVKARDLVHTMHLACASLEMAESIGRPDERARRILGAFTPGPVSVIVAQTEALPASLVTQDGTVGLRIPRHPATLQVIAAVGAPITATSLNRAGEAPGGVAESYLRTFDWPDLPVVHVVADDSAITYDRPSTLVRATGVDLEILRAGPVSEAEIRQAAAD